MEQIQEKQLLIQVTARFKETEVQGHWDSSFQWNHALTNLYYNKVLGIKKDIINIFAPVIVKSMEKILESLLKQSYFASPLALPLELHKNPKFSNLQGK